LDFGFFAGDVKIGVGFRPFWHSLPGPGPQHQEPIFDSSF